MPDFRLALRSGRALVLDGAMGTLLQARGLAPGEAPELFGLRAPEVLAGAHRDYLDAGADVVLTDTFGGTRYKLGPGVDVVDANRRLAVVARQAAGEGRFVAGDVGSTGKFLAPLGEAAFSDVVGAYREQARGLIQGGVDCFICETFFDLAELRAAIIAIREESDLPVISSMTFEDGVSLTGSSPEVYAETMANLGVDVIGVNCGAGPDQMAAVVERLVAVSPVPVLAQPNAGLPILENGKTVFKLGPEEFARQTAAFIDLGARLLGGCCGTTPAHIAALKNASAGRTLKTPAGSRVMALTSRSRLVRVAPGLPVALIGERINPTGKKVLTAELQAGEFGEALRFAGEQVDLGAAVLDVNVGAPMVNEAELLPAAIKAIAPRFETPLCLDSADPAALEAALAVYPASPLVNSISGEPGRMERLAPICKRYGAPFILLPLKGRTLPESSRERLKTIEALLSLAFSMGVDKRLIMVDVLALTVSSRPDAARACLETIRHCAERWKLPTVLGLSNVSFGLPARELLNSTFLTMCATAGLSACIANPSSTRLRESLAASEILLDRDPKAERFIAGFSGWKAGEGGSGPAGQSGPAGSSRAETPGEAVIKGAKDQVLELIEAALTQGRAAAAIVDGELIPAIMTVGEKYERKEYFLPQLLLSAETMALAFERLKPLLEKDASASHGRIVMATVEGDIHDIGKNIVCLMLRNHGFEVHDLGKDVPAEVIVDKAQAVGAAVIGLSALMTTTMTRMAEVVKLVRERNLPSKVMVGGAVLTEAYAQAIGADGYAADAVAAVRLAGELVSRSEGMKRAQGVV